MEKQHAKQRIIKDIKNDDGRIQITGYVKSKESGFVLLDDKTGEIKVNIKEDDFSFNENDLINVIGDLTINVDGEKGIEAEIIQDMNKLNFKYYRKLYEFKKEIE